MMLLNQDRGIVLLLLVTALLKPIVALSTIRNPSLSTTTKIIPSEVSICPSNISGKSIGKRIKFGESIIELHNLVTPAECQWLVTQCIEAADDAKEHYATKQLDKSGLVRLPTISAVERAAQTKVLCADPLPVDVDEVLQRILARVAEYIDWELPSITSTLFGPTKDNFEDASLHQLLTQNQLKFSSREPAINVYTRGGQFLAHKDAQSLTVLVPLSNPKDYSGGGTAFWHQNSRGHRVEAPTIISKPTCAGTGLLFGGCVTHSGVAVEDGVRVVFVASFSLRGCEVGLEQRDIYGDSM